MSECAGRNNQRPEKFHEMLQLLMEENNLTQKRLAECLDVSGQYINDLLRQRRLPSVAVVKKVCAFTGRGPLGRRLWMIAGASAHGWEVKP